jgi:hypothetical protein
LHTETSPACDYDQALWTAFCRKSVPGALETGQVTALGLLRSTWTMLRGRLLAVLVLMSLQDAAIFACQRLADFVTNHGGTLTPFPCNHYSYHDTSCRVCNP